MRYIFIIFFLGISNLIYSQRYIDKSTWTINANLTSLINIITFPTIQLSVEKKLNSSFSLCPELGYQIYNVSLADTAFLNPKGFKINFEFRHYLTKLYASDVSKRATRSYIGLQPFYRRNQYNSSISYHTKIDSHKWNDDEFGVKNISYGFNCIFGLQKSISNKLVVDLHAGLGMMMRNVKNTNLQYDKDSGDILAGTNFIKYIKTLNLSESSGLAVSMLFGFRIGYKL